MKVKQLTKLINDHGTHPRITIMLNDGDANLLRYEGKPENIDDSVAELKVRSFTILGAGCLKIFC